MVNRLNRAKHYGILGEASASGEGRAGQDFSDFGTVRLGDIDVCDWRAFVECSDPGFRYVYYVRWDDYLAWGELLINGADGICRDNAFHSEALQSPDVCSIVHFVWRAGMIFAMPRQEDGRSRFYFADRKVRSRSIGCSENL